MVAPDSEGESQRVMHARPRMWPHGRRTGLSVGPFFEDGVLYPLVHMGHSLPAGSDLAGTEGRFERKDSAIVEVLVCVICVAQCLVLNAAREARCMFDVFLGI